VANKEDTRKIMATLNRALEPKSLSEAKLDTAFQVWQPKLRTAGTDRSIALGWQNGIAGHWALTVK